ncbi:hypothetical protein ACA910_003887 [Epithemia clementina (nom. ined.)]
MIRNDGSNADGLPYDNRIFSTRRSNFTFSTIIQNNFYSTDYDSNAVNTTENGRHTSDNNTQYYYLHIPKSGGTSMLRTFQRNGIAVKDFGTGFYDRPSDFDQWCQERPDVKIFATEGPYFNNRRGRPAHSIIMFRDPVSHVVSQFFHCKISDRPGHTLMPDTLMEWLQHWNNVQATQPRLQALGAKRPMVRWRDKKYACYTPLDFQSWLTGFPQTKEDLNRTFDAVGILSQFEKSTCLFLAQVLKLVPPSCDCTKSRRSMAGRESVIHYSHNVTHHGSTYNLTREERALIENITKFDRRLYAQAAELFAEQVDAVENEYGVKLCGNKKVFGEALVG